LCCLILPFCPSDRWYNEFSPGWRADDHQSEMRPPGRALLAVAAERIRPMATTPQVIEITAGEVTAELKRLGIGGSHPSLAAFARNLVNSYTKS
jgi:hypothetical protein